MSKIKKNNTPNLIKNTISVYEGDINISPRVHKEYIKYHKQINKRRFDYKQTINGAKELFNEKTPFKVKKKLLFLLGEFATPECFQILKRYIDNGQSTHKEWALLALQELRFNVENELYEEGRDMIMSPLGGKRNTLRYYVVVSKKKSEQFVNEEKDMLRQTLVRITKRMQSEVENFELYSSYVLIRMLISIDVSPSDVIDAFLDEFKRILRYHYFMINTHKPTKKEINEYLAMDEVKKL